MTQKFGYSVISQDPEIQAVLRKFSIIESTDTASVASKVNEALPFKVIAQVNESNHAIVVKRLLID